MTKALESLELDHSSPVPLYHQAATFLEQLIVEGHLPPGTKLDGEVELAEQLRISRPTVRAALRELVDKGLLTRRRGAGTVVTAMPLTRPLALTSLHDDLVDAGRTPKTKVLHFAKVPCPEAARSALRLDGTDMVYDVVRLRLSDGDPIALMHNWLPASLVDIDPGDLSFGSLYRVMRRQGVRMHAATQRITADVAGPTEAELLQLEEGDPLVVMTRTTYDPTGVAVEHAFLQYPARSYSVEMTLIER